MEGALIIILIVVVLLAWVHLRDRLNELEARVNRIAARRETAPAAQAASAPPAAPPAAPRVAPLPPPAHVLEAAKHAPIADPVVGRHAPAPFTPRPAPDPQRNWETTLGGDWLNKLGVVLFVIGLALALGYSFTRVGPAGRVAMSVAVSLAMLGTGAAFEPREQYRTFARGLLGGGWAALYFTTYAARAIDAARVIDSALAGAILLTAVAVGMVAHSLRYRSEAVTGLAFYIAFGTLAITQVTSFSVIAIIPLAAALLYVAHRFQWVWIARCGLAATYLVCLSRGDTGTPLGQAQAIFTIYWLLFEIFDLLRPDGWLLPLNAAGFLLLSLLKWGNTSPDTVWMLLAGAAALHAGSAVLRARAGRWQVAATLSTVLAAAAIFLKLDHQWIALALLLLAELLYLAGVQLNEDYLRLLAAGVFTLDVGRLALDDCAVLPLRQWLPAAGLNAAAFYANRLLRAEDRYYSYAAAAMLAMILWGVVPSTYLGVAGMALGVLLFEAARGDVAEEFRIQAWLVALLGAGIVAFNAIGLTNSGPLEPRLVPLGAAALAYYFAYRPQEHERALQLGAASVGTFFLLDALWFLLPYEWVAPAWAAVALMLLLTGEEELSGVAAGAAFTRAWVVNCYGPQRLETVALVIAGLYAAEILAARASFARAFHALAATGLLTILLWYEVTGSVLTVAWGIEGLALLAAGLPLRDRVLRLAGLGLFFTCILKLFVWDLRHLETLPRIFSFLALGAILVSVSWIYTRFRERMERYL